MRPPPFKQLSLFQFGMESLFHSWCVWKNGTETALNESDHVNSSWKAYWCWILPLHRKARIIILIPKWLTRPNMLQGVNKSSWPHVDQAEQKGIFTANWRLAELFSTRGFPASCHQQDLPFHLFLHQPGDSVLPTSVWLPSIPSFHYGRKLRVPLPPQRGLTKQMCMCCRWVLIQEKSRVIVGVCANCHEELLL